MNKNILTNILHQSSFFRFKITHINSFSIQNCAAGGIIIQVFNVWINSRSWVVRFHLPPFRVFSHKVIMHYFRMIFCNSYTWNTFYSNLIKLRKISSHQINRHILAKPDWFKFRFTAHSAVSSQVYFNQLWQIKKKNTHKELSADLKSYCTLLFYFGVSKIILSYWSIIINAHIQWLLVAPPHFAECFFMIQNYSSRQRTTGDSC